MSGTEIVCTPTSWFKVRVIGMAVLFLGMGIYFFYDAAIGYPSKNEVYFTYKAFESGGSEVSGIPDEGQWRALASDRIIDFKGYPVPGGMESVRWPEELADYQMMKSGWHGAWQQYSHKREWPLRPVDTPLDGGKIREQWIAGGVCCALFVGCLFLLFRTLGRQMSIKGREVTASGRSFNIADIEKLDVRKWKNKGIAYAFVNDRRIRLDGFCYGGFSQGDQNGAEEFMRLLRDLYEGDVMDYEEAGD